MAAMWTAWTGATYGTRRLLILGESCYDWQDVDGRVETPQPDHPVRLVESQLVEPPKDIRFMRMLTRAITGEYAPNVERAQEAWCSVAFTNYVPISVGFGPRIKQKPEGWDQARVEWPGLLNALRPRNVIVLGFATWRDLPTPDMSRNDDVPFSDDPASVTERWRTYRLADGSVARCWSHWHPAAGASWTSIKDAIQKAEETPLPEGPGPS